MLAQALLVGLQTRHFLARPLQIGIARIDRSLRGGQLLLPAFDGTGADEVLATQLAIALCIQFGHFQARQHIIALRLGRDDRAGCTGLGRLAGTKPLIEIDRLDLRQQLPRLHRLADIDMDRLDPPRRRRPDEIAAPGFDRANAEQGRRYRTACHPHGGHLCWRQRPRARDDEGEANDQRGCKKGEAELAAEQTARLHDCPPSPAR